MLRLFGLVAVGALLAGCSPQVGPDDWTLEPIPFETALGRTDFAFGMHQLATDGSGGFWASSGRSWLHVGGDGETLAMFSADDGDPLAGIGAMAALSDTEFVATRSTRVPVLSVLDTTTMKWRDLPGEPPVSSDDFGDFAFGDVAVHEGDAILVRYQPRPPDAYLDYQVLRVDLDDGSRTLLYSAPISLGDAPDSFPGVPPVDVDADADGRIYLATPSERIVLDAEGAVLSAEPQSADHPRVSVRPDGTALWWGGEPEKSAIRGVTIGGSAEAQEAIAQREDCDDVYRTDALWLSDGEAQHPLPFLCGANAAVWTGDSWVVAIGGEGDGVLVRLTPPDARD
ncbi:hypothetical protein RS85_00734 [Microbacterium sp. SA39]|nr:hypothetical protein RS85_00734 [Microbacterium sp. SA39]